MKKKVLVLIAVFMLLTTGCAKTMVDSNKQKVVNDVTGQNLTSNILCQPEEEHSLNKYLENNDKLEIKVENLPKCSEMKVYDKNSYNGLWVALFVRPLAWLIIKLGMFLNNYGFAVMIIGLLIRVVMIPLSAKSVKQSESMKNIQPELAKIEKKYEGKTDQESMMKKSQETLALYQKNNINPMSSCLVTLLQFPLFFGFLEAINRVPAIFEGNFFVYQLGTTPLTGIRSGNYWYILLIILIVLFTALSFKFSMSSMSSQASEQGKQMKYYLIFTTVFIGIASIQLPSAIALYWVVTNAFSVVQTLIIKRNK